MMLMMKRLAELTSRSTLQQWATGAPSIIGGQQQSRGFRKETAPQPQDRSSIDAVDWPKVDASQASELDLAVAELSKKYQPLAVEILKEAIRIPEDHIGTDKMSGTSNHEGPRVEYLRKAIIECKAVEKPEDVFFDEFGNLVWEVTLGNRKNAEGKSVIFFDGHTDTVNPLPEEWKKIGGIDVYKGITDPSQVNYDKLKEQLGYLPSPDEFKHLVFGRGGADQLSGVVAQIIATKIMLELKGLGSLEGVFIRSHGTVAEEDNDGGGPMYVMRKFIPEAQRGDLLPDVVVHTEGTGCNVEGPCGIYIGHRGRMQIEVSIVGRSSHGSMPHMGLNPLEYGAEVISQARKQYDDQIGFLNHPFLGTGSRTASWSSLATPSNCAVPAAFTFRFDRRLTVGETPAKALQSIESLPAIAEARARGLKVTVGIPHYRQKTWRGYQADNEELYMGWSTPPDHEAVKSAYESWLRVVTGRLDGQLGSAHPLTRIPSTPRVGSWVFSTDGVGYPIAKDTLGYPNIPPSKRWIETETHRHPAMIGIGIGFEANTHKIGEFIDARHFPAAIALMSRFPSLYHQRTKNATSSSSTTTTTTSAGKAASAGSCSFPTQKGDKTGKFQSTGQGERHYRVWKPQEGTPSAIVLVIHGYAEHSARYDGLARALNDKTKALVVGIDLEGHGLSSGDRAVLDFKTTLQDLHKLVSIARTEANRSDLPLFVCGHSMGGLLTARYVQEYGAEAQVKGAVFLGAVLGHWEWIERILTTCPPEAEHIPGSTPNLAGMSRDVITQQSYDSDPLIYHGAVPRRLIEREAKELAEMRKQTPKLKLPMLVLHGSDDPFVPYKNSLQGILDSPSNDLAFRVYPGARHELVNETNKEEVITDIVDFVHRNL